MPVVKKQRIIRPSSRKATSKSYKVDTKHVGRGDTLEVTIKHESTNLHRTYYFSGDVVAHKDSIHFTVNESLSGIDIRWSGAEPEETSIAHMDTFRPKKRPTPTIDADDIEGQVEALPPIVDDHCRLLILGTMPGAESLRQQAYYSHPRNLFWKLIATVTDEEAPDTYDERVAYLKKHGIALWDICQSCIREGSLDADISAELPNDIHDFITEHPTIQAIAFNGKTAAKLYAKHIGSIPGVRLLSLPSSSPANAGVTWEDKEEKWGKLKTYL